MSKFDSYRRWFNKNFKLSLDGKFKGLSTVVRMLGERVFEMFCNRLAKHLRTLNSRVWYANSGDKFTIRVSGHSFKLYSI